MTSHCEFWHDCFEGVHVTIVRRRIGNEVFLGLTTFGGHSSEIFRELISVGVKVYVGDNFPLFERYAGNGTQCS